MREKNEEENQKLDGAQYNKLLSLKPHPIQVSHLKINLKYYNNSIKNSKRRKVIDDALVNLVVKDLQPSTIVEDCAFRHFVQCLDPQYILPSHRTLCLISMR